MEILKPESYAACLLLTKGKDTSVVNLSLDEGGRVQIAVFST